MFPFCVATKRARVSIVVRRHHHSSFVVVVILALVLKVAGVVDVDVPVLVSL